MEYHIAAFLWSTFCFSCLLDNFTTVRFHSFGKVKVSLYMIIDEISTLWVFLERWSFGTWKWLNLFFIFLYRFFFFFFGSNNIAFLSFTCLCNSRIRWSCKSTILKHMGLHTGVVGIALQEYWRLKEYGSWIFSFLRDKIISFIFFTNIEV